MSALVFAPADTQGTTTTASKPWGREMWEALAKPGGQAAEQDRVLVNGTSSEPRNSAITISNINTGLLHLLATLLPASAGFNVLSNPHYEPLNTFEIGIVEASRTNSATSSAFLRMPAVSGHSSGWFGPEALDHNRVRPRRHFMVTLDLNYRGRRKALPVNDLE
jgi:hypothetical protein